MDVDHYLYISLIGGFQSLLHCVVKSHSKYLNLQALAFIRRQAITHSPVALKCPIFEPVASQLIILELFSPKSSGSEGV